MISKNSIIVLFTLLGSLLAISTGAVARQAQPMPSTPKLFISDSGYGSLIEVNPTTFAVGSFHFGLGSGTLQVSAQNELFQADSDNIWLVKPDWSRHRWAGHDNNGQYRVVDTESLYVSHNSAGISYQVDLSGDGYLSEFDLGGEREVIVQTNVSGFTFKGNDFSRLYFVQDTTNSLFTAPTVPNAPTQFITSNSNLDGLFSMTYRDGYFYGLNRYQKNILRFSEDGSNMNFIISGSPLNNPRQMTWGLDGHLYVADSGAGNVFRINPSTGDWSAVFPGGTLSNPVGVAFIGEPEPEPEPEPFMKWVQADDPAGNTPEGYTSWDLMVTTSTNLAVMELLVEADSAGDIYQDPVGGNTEPNQLFFPTFPSLEFDSYVTMPVTFGIIGGPVDIDPAAVVSFTDQEVSVAWGPSGGASSGPGTFQVARITVKDGSFGTWKFHGWQTGGGEGIYEGSLPIWIPEPATLGLLVIAALLSLRRRG